MPGEGRRGAAWAAASRVCGRDNGEGKELALRWAPQPGHPRVVRHPPRFNIGYSTGMLDGILTSLDIPCTRIHAAIWKRQLGLFKKGKPGSMALAHQLLPAAAPFLRRAWNDGVVVK